MRRLSLLVSLLAFACSASAAQAVTPRSFFGVIADGPLLAGGQDLGRQAADMRATGIGSTRVALYWSDVQPVDGEHAELAAFDAVVLAAARQRIAVLPVVQRAPAWAAVRPGEPGSPPRKNADYARLMTLLVDRYGPAGSLWRENPGVTRTPIRSWQVWNEPDITKYWTGRPWTTTYLALLKSARTAIKAADPGAKVVLSGLTNRSWEELGLLYRHGARPLFDVAAIHPFSRRVANVVKIVTLARAAMKRAGDGRKPLLLSEISWSSGRGISTYNYGWETSEAGQADRVHDALTALAARRRSLGILGLYWYTWLSRPIGSNDSFDYGGLRRLSDAGAIVDKPALAAFRQTATRLER